MITEPRTSDRQHRVRFKRAVRVVPLQAGPPRAFRVLSGNLSREGMFLSMPEPFTEGTRLALSLEAGGRVLPFAQAEVVWRVLGEGHHPGFGVRFTEFLHPRAHDLVHYLVDHLDRGVPLPAPRLGRGGRLAIAACLALVAGAAITAAGWALWPQSRPGPSAVAEVSQPVPGPAGDELSADAPLAAAVPEALPAAPVVAAAPELAAPIDLPEAPTAKQAAAAVAPTAPRGAELVSSSGQMPLPKSAVSHLSWHQRGDLLTLELEPLDGARWSSVFMLRSPSRLVVDLVGKAPAKSFLLPASSVPHLHSVRLGRLGKTGTRLVFDFEAPPASFSQSGSTLQLRF